MVLSRPSRRHFVFPLCFHAHERISRLLPLFVLIFLAIQNTIAATIVSNNVTATLGPDFIFDKAATGGGDNNSTVFIRDISGYWGPDAIVTLKGLGWASSAAGTVATDVTATFTDLGPDGIYGTGDDKTVGTVEDGLNFAGAAEYAWAFDSNIVFTATGSGLRIQIEGFSNGAPANIRRKTTNSSATSPADVKLSLAGTVVGGIQPPATDAATSSGFWDIINWTTGSATLTGGLPDTDAALIGSENVVIYRGIPSQQTVATLNLGHAGTYSGRGTLIVSNGIFHITGDVNAGLGNSANDGSIQVYNGTLQIDGNANFGRFVDGADGILETGNGGTVTIAGNLNLGAFLYGGALLRFNDPGSSSIHVGETLLLGRTALGLTFDTNYVHVPGATITLVEYAARSGQFVNFRRRDEFNAGPNRFRINYDVPVDGGLKAITLTCLTNWEPVAGPNVIFILADDEGYADLRMQGNAAFPMPEVEKLAAGGARFTDAYVTAGVCHPSRSGILTGRYQQRFGTDNNLGANTPSYNGTAASQRTIAQRLQALGYYTYGVGKWHLGNTVEYHPNQRGFNSWYGINAGSRSYYTATGEDNLFQNDMTLRPQDEGLYVADRIGNACVAFIDDYLTNHSNRPFYIYCAFTSVHGPMDMKPDDPRYTRLQEEFGLTFSNYTPEIVFPGKSESVTQSNRYMLAAMSLALDENVGKIVNKVDSAGLSSNTIIIYINDNGGAGWNSSAGGNYSYNLPLRGYKGSSMTDGSIRVPAAISWPGVIPPGQIITNPVISLDFLATAVNASGNAPAAVRNGLDGIDLLPLLRDGIPLPADRVLCWRAGDSDSGGSAARMGDWKILANNATGIFKLYNLRADIGETTDVSAQNPVIFDELKARFHAWNSLNIEPLYGSDGNDVMVDAGLERSGIAGGYRINNRNGTPAYLTATLRDSLSTTTNFSLGFYLRPAETNHGTGEQLWFVLGDSADRAKLIRAGVDFGSGLLRLVEGKTGDNASVELATLPEDFEAATLSYTAATKTLNFALGGTNVSLVLSGNYDSLGIYGCGAASMEGEVTQPFQPAYPTATVQDFNLQSTGTNFSFIAKFTGDAVFGPKLERAAAVNGPYQADRDCLIENLGGGVYQFETPTDTNAFNEFFRVTFNQP